MADTHPNAFRTEAAEKRTQAAQLKNEADELDARADALERAAGVPLTTPATPEEDLPEGGATYDPQAENNKKEDKTNKDAKK